MVNQDSSNAPTAPSCPQGCPTCPLDEGLTGWTSAHESATAGELRRGRLIGAAAGVFVAPLLAAVAVALAVGGSETRQFVGLAIGLTTTLVGSALIGRWIRRRRLHKEPA